MPIHPLAHPRDGSSLTEHSLALVHRIRSELLPRAQRHLTKSGQQLNRSAERQAESADRLLSWDDSRRAALKTDGQPIDASDSV